jgi:germination protein M
MKRKTNKMILITGALFLLIGGTAAATYFITANSSNKTKAPATAAKKTTGQTQSSSTSDAGGAASSATDDTVKLTLYFGDVQAQYLVPETRTIPASDNLAQAAVEQLITGPTEPNHLKTAPSGMTIQSVSVDGDLARANFGANFAKLYPQGSAGELMFVYSVVDTLTELPGVTRVQFLVDGQTVSRYGNLDLTQPLQRDASLIAK